MPSSPKRPVHPLAAALGLVLLAVTAAPAALATTLVPTGATTAAKPSASDKAERLDALYTRYWDESLELNPVQATFLGDPRYNDRLPDFLSEDYRQQTLAFFRRWLRTVEDIGPDGLQGQDLLNYEIFVKNARDTLEGDRFPGQLMPLNQFGNIAGFAAQLGSGRSAQPAKSSHQHQDAIVSHPV